MYAPDREKIHIDLHKQFLNLRYKIAKYEMSGLEPPANLLKKFKDIERKLRLFSKARQ